MPEVYALHREEVNILVFPTNVDILSMSYKNQKLYRCYNYLLKIQQFSP